MACHRLTAKLLMWRWGRVEGSRSTRITVNISVGDTVRWTWDGSGHSVTSGPPCAADSQFCSPNDTSCFPGVLSNQGYGLYAYISERWQLFLHCLAHCVIGMTGVVNVTGGCAPSGWSAAGPANSVCPTAGVYFPANGKFYAMGGRASDTAGNEFTHPFEYDPNTNSLDHQGSHLSRQHGEQHSLRRAHRRRDALHLLCGRLGQSDPHGHDRSRLPL